MKGCRRGNGGEGRTESHSSPFMLPFAANQGDGESCIRLYVRSTHVILYKYTRRGILTMLPPRSLDQSCPESHARCKPSWLSSSTFSRVFLVYHVYFHLSILRPLLLLSIISRIYSSSTRHGGFSDGFRRMRRRRHVQATSSARSPVIPRSSFDFEG